MGLQQSYMACHDENKKCSFGTPVQYTSYAEYKKSILDTDPIRNRKLDEYVCGKYLGKPTECCWKEASDANDIVEGPLIKIVKDSNEIPIEYQICQCETQKCEQKRCADFQKPTKYTLCKARSQQEQNVRKVNQWINSIVASNTFPDCYAPCK